MQSESDLTALEPHSYTPPCFQFPPTHRVAGSIRLRLTSPRCTHESMVTLIPSSEDVRIYEIAVMVQPDLQPKEEAELIKGVDDLLAEAQAKLLFKDVWSKRGLAYKIKGHAHAKFIIYYIELDPSKIRDIDHQLRLIKGVLRHLVVIPPKGYEAVGYEEKYQQWLKTRETVGERRTREKDEAAKQAVIAKAKRETKRVHEKKPEAKPELKMEQLEQQLDKLISDTDLKL